MVRTIVGMNKQTQAARLAPVLVGAAVALGGLGAQERSPNELVKATQSGGYVLVMRHASSPREAPTKEVANTDNTKLERQLDEAGRRGATAECGVECVPERHIARVSAEVRPHLARDVRVADARLRVRQTHRAAGAR